MRLLRQVLRLVVVEMDMTSLAGTQGEPVDVFCVILSGTIEAKLGNSQGKKVVLDSLQAPNEFGQYGLLTENRGMDESEEFYQVKTIAQTPANSLTQVLLGQNSV